MKVTNVNPQHITRIGAFRAREYRCVYARVARRLKVTRSMVSQVALGRKASARIERALLKEFQRIERRIDRMASELAA